ncbi:MAG: hypothetical protein QGD90_09425 [Candidatus Hydrogenedentes bacterium]|nr:hypothetical protein [Candidatus Hydrogenedentota bacterium]
MSNDILESVEAAEEQSPEPTPEEQSAASIAEAETVVADLAERSKADKGAPFEPDTLDAINVLKVNEPAAFQRLMYELKKAGVGIRDLKTELGSRRLRLVAENNTGQEEDVERAGPYMIAFRVICHEKKTNEGPITVPLCNFDARIIGEEVRDDGAEQTTFFTVEGTLQDGKPLPKADVPADRFGSLNWVTANWGTAAVVYAGQGTKDHLRVAIQLLSGTVPRRRVFAHLGWRKINDEWLYLHDGGAIGPNGPLAEVQVQMSDTRLACYALPEPPGGDELKAAIRASLSVLELGPARITCPLMAAVYRAPLGEVATLDLSIFLVGPTGSQKTEATAIAQAHYGAKFHGKNLPGNWATTANGLEKQAFLVKDAIFTVDDFSPTGTMADVQRLHRDADRLFRGQGNRAGRGRMRADGTMRPEYYPRGIVVSSGEDIPRSQSLRARILIIELSSGDIDLAKLTQAQSEASEGRLAQAMAGYIQWLAPRIETLKKHTPENLKGFRARARENQVSHDRTPDIVASLALGWDTFLQFAHHAEAITDEEQAAYSDQCWQTLLEVAEAQAGYQADEEPAARFLALLSSVVATGQAHLVDAGSGEKPDSPESWGWRKRTFTSGGFEQEEWQPKGNRIGWVDASDVYLDPDASFAAVQRLASQQGSSLAITQQTLWKRLAEKGKLASQESRGGKSRNKVRKMIGGHRRTVIHFFTDTLLPSRSGPSGPSGPRLSDSNGLGAEKLGHFSGNDKKVAHESGPEALENSEVGPNGPHGPQMEDKGPLSGEIYTAGSGAGFEEGEI